MILDVTPDEARRIIERLNTSDEQSDHRLAGKLLAQA